MESVDKMSTLPAFGKPALPLTLPLSPTVIGVVRLLFATFILGMAVVRMAGPGYNGHTFFMAKSRLRPSTIRFRGWRILAPFTYWCWIMLGVSFGLSGILSLLAANESDSQETTYPIMGRLALLSFEVVAPSCFLVSAVVKYALWPKAFREGGGPAGTRPFKTFYGLSAHNANVIMVLIEVGLLGGGLKVHLDHVAVAPLFGVAYVIFSWVMADQWHPEHGPQFFYFFLDTTLGWITTLALLSLISILLFFYAAFCAMDDVLEYLGDNLIIRLFGIVVVSSFVCRFRD
eukprot:CAMPEP_0198294568 /NCGR_PEP_ID=MMETSP1449-20131203/23063_1 /TAXON_ID=420275 /ORGANISM="Attheya septentrionalis, Strain CCMP2084" /LENGTH=287 /DNA_ID=CAMNT_0043994553 /DNA_START=68 /DNA_END=931 /DNA_ORIENTATION=+